MVKEKTRKISMGAEETNDNLNAGEKDSSSQLMGSQV